MLWPDIHLLGKPLLQWINGDDTKVFLGMGGSIDFVKAISSMKLKGQPLNGALQSLLSCLIIQAEAQMLVSYLREGSWDSTFWYHHLPPLLMSALISCQVSVAPPAWGVLLYGRFVVKLTLPQSIKDLLDSYSFPGFPSLSLGNFLRNVPIIGDFYNGITLADVSGGFMVVGNKGSVKLATVDGDNKINYLNIPSFW